MDSNRSSTMSDDLSSLAWVQEELRKSLEAAHKALRRFLKESEGVVGSDVDDVDPAVLRTARQQLHQGVGALELVGMPAPATVLRASEAAVQRFIQKPQRVTLAAVEAIEKASFGLLDYLARVLAGKSVSPVSLFPQYRVVQELAGADRIHPADLWNADWRWAEVPSDEQAAPRRADEAARAELESLLLSLMRNVSPPTTAQRMSDLCAGLGSGAVNLQAGTFWKLAAAFFEAQAHGLLRIDVYSKRVAARILAQFGMLERGESAVSDRLALDLLFFCAQCPVPAGARAPRLQAVREAYGLTDQAPVDYEQSTLGRFDPALLVQARKRVAAAKDSWSSVAGGEMHRLPSLPEQFSLVGDSLQKIYPAGEELAQALQRAVQQTVDAKSSPPAPLAMEVATSVLYLEASLEDVEFDHPEQASRTARLAQRIESVRQGQPAAPLEPWMEDLYRRVSDRQTMGSVVQELRSSLLEAEKLIDQFFRNPADRSVLLPVPGQLSAMRGVLSVLGMDQASQAVLRMREVVDELISTEVDAQRASSAGTFERLAGNLGALGFLIDMLSYQPQMAKSLFVFDGDTGELRPVMGRAPAAVADAQPEPAEPLSVSLVEPRLIEQAQTLAEAAAREDVPLEDVSAELRKLAQEAVVADQPSLAATLSQVRAAVEQVEQGKVDAHEAREQVAQAMADFVATASDAVGLEPVAAAGAASPVAAPVANEEDDEMLAVFLEEAQEVMASAGEALDALGSQPDDLEQITVVRRAFHTLKGSSRMVGLHDFGEAAWACEQLYNMWLADQRPATEELRSLTGDALEYLAAWVGEIASGAGVGHASAPVRAAADAMRLRGELQRIVPAAPAVIATEVVEDFDLQPVAPAPVVGETPAAPLPGFELDLSGFEGAAAGVDPGAVPAVPEEAVPASFDAPPLQAFETEPVEQGQPSLPSGEAVAAVPKLDLDFDLDLPSLQPAQPSPAAEPVLPVAEALEMPAAPASPEPPAEAPSEQFKVVGPLRIGIPLFNIYLTEADELSRRLITELAEWGMELHRPVGETAIALAHSLAGSSATVGFTDLSHLARQLEHALVRSQSIGRGHAAEARLFVDVAEEIRHLLHQFAAGFLKEPAPELLQRLAAHEIESAQWLEQANASLSREGVPTTGSGGLDAPQELLSAPEVVDLAGLETATEPPTEPAPLAAVEAAVAAAASLSAPPSSMMPLELGRAEFKPLGAIETQGAAHHAQSALPADVQIDDDIDAVDAVDPDLFPIFEEEGLDLLPQLSGQMREWASRPEHMASANACMRTLHTFKGGARLAGAMRLGEMAHRLESAIERLISRGDVTAADVEPLEGQVDALNAVFEMLRNQDAQSYAEAASAVQPLVPAPSQAAQPDVPAMPQAVEPPAAMPGAPVVAEPVQEPLEPAAPAEPASHTAQAPAASPEPLPAGQPEATPLPPAREIDWTRFLAAAAAGERPAATPARTAGLTGQAAVRVRAQLLDRLVNSAGEVSITRARLESEVGQIKNSLSDLTDNLERLRQQLRDIELQAETQMASRMEQAKAEGHTFDPLEFDRFTRFQELTRMMAESVNDVATVQRSLQRTLETAEDELAAQARLTRELQDDLLRTRMVEFEGLSERLYRVVRLAAKETGKQVRLDIVGGSIEVDRGVLERMTAAFEHLLRNSVTHGIEPPDVRVAQGKDAAGTIVVALHQEGNEVAIEFRDDGAGLNLPKIRDRAVAAGLLPADAQPSDADLANLIFTPGFSTAETVTELAGRGVGMDVVRADVNAMGGRIETATAPGQGTSFKLVLPLTTAVTQVVMLRCGQVVVGVPANLVEIVRRASPEDVAASYESGTYSMGEQRMPFFWLGALLQSSARGTETGRTLPVVVIRSAQQRVALHVDEVLGNQEVVVKNLGPQLSRLPGLAGMTLLASGAVALIYNPVALATVYGGVARAMTAAALQAAASAVAVPVEETQPEVPATPLVLVVDDSLTVRRVTQRLLAREGYRVALAKDGLDALERLAEERPAVVLSDIEMPRMDGFDLVRNIRSDAKLAHLPVIMITSRIAQKHRDYAAELGVNHYLGKPYSEEELLALIGRYTEGTEAKAPAV
ncbi:MAG TPA: Hpt domain-containing protein [Burkholderiaceae bacterium]|nr:Hpt domain-containing protein [Burkholderiaceae bacterium]